MTGAAARRPLPLLALAASAFALSAAGYAAWKQGRTYDEPVHLAWSRRLYEDRVSERYSNALFNSKTPVSVVNVMARQAARRSLDIRDLGALRFFSRLPSLVWLALLLATTYAWTRALANPEAACLAVALLALDPNLVAHASVATVDVAYALATLLVMAAAWRFSVSPGPTRGAVLGTAVGAAFVVKFTTVVLLALLMLVLAPAAWRAFRSAPRALLGGVAAAALVAVAVIDAGYLFVGVGASLAGAPLRTPLMHALAAALPAGRTPLPLDFLTGLDLIMGGERTRPWEVVILGKPYPDGVWFYFGLLWLLKTPLTLLGLLVVGSMQARRLAAASPWLRFVAVVLLLHVAYFSLFFRAQIGYRYVLMCLPLGAIVAATGLASLARPGAGVVTAASLLLSCAVAEQLPYLGNPLAYTNLLVWPKQQAFRLLADSNIDWGQNDEKIRGWIAERGLRTHLDPPHLLPGHNTLDLNLAAGVSNFERYRWLRENLEPTGHLGHTHLLFEVPEATYRRFLDEARALAPLPIAARLCPAPKPAGVLTDRELLRLPDAAEGRMPVVCFAPAAPLDVSLLLEAGSLVVLRPGQPLRAGETLEAGQSLAYRLAPGLHALILGRVRDARGSWRVESPVPFAVTMLPVDRRGLPLP